MNVKAGVSLRDLTDSELTKATRRRNHPEVTRLLDLELSYRFKLRGFDPSDLTDGQRIEGLRFRADVAARKGDTSEATIYREAAEKVIRAAQRQGRLVLDTEAWGEEVAHA